MMTFEEFKRLAIHPPRKREKTIFHISLVTIDTDRLDYPNSEEVTEEEYGQICDRIDALSEEERAARRVYYPSFSVIANGLHAYAETLESAEQMVQRLVDEQENVYCIFVTEYPFCEFLYYGGNCVSRRVYGPDGEKIDERLFCDFFTDERNEFRHFRGRMPEQIRFKEGDIVEILRGDEVTLEVVVSLPPTVEWCYQYALRGLDTKYNPCTTDAGREQWAFEDGYMLDVTDDSYTVIDRPDYRFHSHPDALCVFKPRFPIPIDVEQKLCSYYETVKKQYD